MGRFVDHYALGNLDSFTENYAVYPRRNPMISLVGMDNIFNREGWLQSKSQSAVPKPGSSQPLEPRHVAFSVSTDFLQQPFRPSLSER